jgi:hypothetical protein
MTTIPFFAASMMVATSASAATGKASAEVSTDDPALQVDEGAQQQRGANIELTADMVVGYGHVPTLNAALPTTLTTGTLASVDDTKITSDSYILGLGWWLRNSLRLGFRLPIAHAQYSPGESKLARGVTALGNLEFSVLYERQLSKSLALIPSLALTLPTAPGSELPAAAQVEANPSATYGNGTADRYSTLRAAAGSRGFEENPLFSSQRFGIVPRVDLSFRSGKIEIAPFVKMDNLFSSTKSATEGWLGNIVGGASVGVGLAKWLDFGIRAWASYALQKDGRDDNLLVDVEPQLRLHFGPIHPVIGLLIPVLPISKDSRTLPSKDPVYDPRFVAFRLAVAAKF